VKFYTISGLGADQRIFKYLNLPYDTIALDWILPFKKETLKEYALRLSKEIDTSVPFGIIGVSFGGMLAIEISNVLKPEKTILISSAQTKHQLPTLYKLIGKLKIIPFLPYFCFNLPPFLASKLLRAQNKKLLRDILQDTDLKFVKWAIQAICKWENETIPKNVLHIHGSNDLVIPIPKDSTIKVVKGGGHFMVVDKAEDVNSYL